MSWTKFGQNQVLGLTYLNVFTMCVHFKAQLRMIPIN